MVLEMMAKEGIRPYGHEHAEAVLRLYERRFLDNRPIDAARRAALSDFFRRSIFEDPFRADDLSSLVYVTDTGEVTGFLGILPRDMDLDGTPMRVAVASAFMVDPKSRPAGLALLRHLLRGPQGLTLTDGATDHTRQILERLGFRAFPTMSTNWFRVFRPAQLVLSRFARTPTTVRRALAWTGRPICGLTDQALRKVGDLGSSLERPPSMRSQPLDDRELFQLVGEVAASRRLRPRYDFENFRWVLDQWRCATHRGTYVQNVVERVDGSSLGWYVGHLQRGGSSEIVQVGALHDRDLDAVLSQVLFDAMTSGTALVQGRLDPRLQHAALANDCYFRPSAWTLAHARDPAALDAIQQADVFLSGLENERPW